MDGGGFRIAAWEVGQSNLVSLCNSSVCWRSCGLRVRPVLSARAARTSPVPIPHARHGSPAGFGGAGAKSLLPFVISADEQEASAVRHPKGCSRPRRGRVGLPLAGHPGLWLRVGNTRKSLKSEFPRLMWAGSTFSTLCYPIAVWEQCKALCIGHPCPRDQPRPAE